MTPRKTRTKIRTKAKTRASQVDAPWIWRERHRDMEMDNSRIQDYIRSLDPGHGPVWDAIAREAREEKVPIIRQETGAFLQALVAAKQPKAILEVGTAVGYSALLMCQAMPSGCHVTTIENYRKRISKARENFQRAGRAQDVTLLEGEAGQVLKALEGPFDFIFMDGAKGQYLNWLPDILRLLPLGGVLLSDNVFHGGDIVESRFAVERRDRTIHRRMREYLYTLTHMEGLATSVIPIGDGVAFSVRTAGEGA